MTKLNYTQNTFEIFNLFEVKERFKINSSPGVEKTNFSILKMSEYNSASFLNDVDKEELCSSAESTPSQVRRRMTDVKLTKEKYVDKAKNTISAGRTPYYLT